MRSLRLAPFAWLIDGTIMSAEWWRLTCVEGHYSRQWDDPKEAYPALSLTMPHDLNLINSARMLRVLLSWFIYHLLLTHLPVELRVMLNQERLHRVAALNPTTLFLNFCLIRNPSRKTLYKKLLPSVKGEHHYFLMQGHLSWHLEGDVAILNLNFREFVRDL